MVACSGLAAMTECVTKRIGKRSGAAALVSEQPIQGC